MTVRKRIISSRIAPAAALPKRVAAVAKANGHTLKQSARWLATSREFTNYTYDLTDRNLEHLAWWVATLTGRPVAEIRAYLAELPADEQLRRHIETATAASDLRRVADKTVRYARRAGWYAITRALQPAVVVETGTDKGLGSCVFAAALLRNGAGRLVTIDVNDDSGYLITGPYAEVTDRIVDDSVRALQGIPDVDVLLHDSWHTYEHETAEFDAARLVPGALVLSDNAHVTTALADWADRTGRTFTYFAEQPAQHWYPGGGIGAAYTHS